MGFKCSDGNFKCSIGSVYHYGKCLPWILNAVIGNFKGSIGGICHCYG